MPAGRYRIENIVRNGAVSTVFRARDLRRDIQVWLEIFHPERLGSAVDVARFTSQAPAENQLKSEHAQHILDVGIWDPGSPYVASEFLEGSDLATWLRQRGVLSESQAADFVIQACDPLAEAHSCGVVHRDIKPANLFAVEGAGIEASIKVLGWAISRASGPVPHKPEGAAGHPIVATAESWGIVGTPRYMAPEQWRMAHGVDERADIWALGITLCELVTGHIPFPSNSMKQLYAAVISGEPLRLRERFHPLSARLEAVIIKCLETERVKRYQNVAKLAVALMEFASERSKPLVARICSMPKRDSR